MTRWASRTDANHRELLDALVDLGWTIKSTHQLGDFVDAVGKHKDHPGVVLFEFKAAKGKLTESQHKLLAEGWPVVILRSVDDVVVFTREGGGWEPR